MSPKIIFMGSDPIALPLLNWLADSGESSVEISSIYTQPDRPRGRGKKVVPNEIKKWALDKGYEVRQPERMKKAERLQIEADGVDAILVMAFGHILSQKLIDTPKAGIWNFHTSLLPKYRGASPIQCAVASGDSETGVSLMEMVLEMDAGPVLDVEKVEVGRMDTALDVEARLAEGCVPLIRRNLGSILSGESSPASQDSSQANYVRKLTKSDGVIDFRVDAKTLASRINGLYPWPGTRFQHGDIEIKVGLADFDEADVSREPGTVVSSGAPGLRVACGAGSIFLKRLQRPGGKMLDAADFFRGYQIEDGAMLASADMPELIRDSS